MPLAKPGQRVALEDEDMGVVEEGIHRSAREERIIENEDIDPRETSDATIVAAVGARGANLLQPVCRGHKEDLVTRTTGAVAERLSDVPPRGRGLPSTT